MIPDLVNWSPHPHIKSTHPIDIWIVGKPQQEGSLMFTPQQYRAKAAEYAELIKTAGSADEEQEFRKLEMSFLALASNTQWMADNHDKTLHPSDAIQDVAAIANRNDEGGAPLPPRR